MEIYARYLAVFLFIVLPLALIIINIIILMIKGLNHQKELKAQSDALFKKLERTNDSIH